LIVSLGIYCPMITSLPRWYYIERSGIKNIRTYIKKKKNI